MLKQMIILFSVILKKTEQEGNCIVHWTGEGVGRAIIQTCRLRASCCSLLSIPIAGLMTGVSNDMGTGGQKGV